MKEPSNRYYIGIADPGEDGITPRLELIFEGKKIVEACYNEIFADTREAIREEDLKKYYRQSHLHKPVHFIIRPYRDLHSLIPQLR